MSTLQQVALLMFLIFLPMGRGVFCNLLLFKISSVHCIIYISASYFVFMLLTVADLVKLNPEFDEFSLLFHITAAFVPGVFVRGNQRQFLENICSEDDLRSRIFGIVVLKFLACLLLLGFSNI